MARGAGRSVGAGEEDQVARGGVGQAVDRGPDGGLLLARPRQLHAQLAEHVLGEARAVEALRRCPSPHVGRALELRCLIDHVLAGDPVGPRRPSAPDAPDAAGASWAERSIAIRLRSPSAPPLDVSPSAAPSGSSLPSSASLNKSSPRGRHPRGCPEAIVAERSLVAWARLVAKASSPAPTEDRCWPAAPRSASRSGSAGSAARPIESTVIGPLPTSAVAGERQVVELGRLFTQGLVAPAGPALLVEPLEHLGRRGRTSQAARASAQAEPRPRHVLAAPRTSRPAARPGHRPRGAARHGDHAVGRLERGQGDFGGAHQRLGLTEVPLRPPATRSAATRSSSARIRATVARRNRYAFTGRSPGRRPVRPAPRARSADRSPRSPVAGRRRRSPV